MAKRFAGNIQSDMPDNSVRKSVADSSVNLKTIAGHTLVESFPETGLIPGICSKLLSKRDYTPCWKLLPSFDIPKF